MKVAMHNWMRAEPVETTIRRLAKYGYDGIEISYDSVELAPGRARHGRRPRVAQGERHRVRRLDLADVRRPRPDPRRSRRARGLGRLPPEVHHDDQGAARRRRRPRHDEHRPLRGRQGEGDGLARGGVGVGRRGPQGGPRARERRGRADRGRAAQPLRDELRQPPRPGAAARRGGRPRRRRLPRRLPHEPGGVRPPAGVPQRRRPPVRRPRRRQQPDGRRPGPAALGRHHRHAQGDRLRRLDHGRVRAAARPHAGQPVQERDGRGGRLARRPSS